MVPLEVMDSVRELDLLLGTGSASPRRHGGACARDIEGHPRNHVRPVGPRTNIYYSDTEVINFIIITPDDMRQEYTRVYIEPHNPLVLCEGESLPLNVQIPFNYDFEI